MTDRSCLFHAVKCESTFKGHVKGSARTKTTIITKQLFDVLHKVEKLLISDLKGNLKSQNGCRNSFLT
jgi:hypothetical protein